MTDSKALREAITSAGIKYKHLAKVLGLSAFGLQKKIDGITEFKASEIATLSSALGLSVSEREHIFFAKRSD